MEKEKKLDGKKVLQKLKDEGISTALLLIGLGGGVTIMRLAKGVSSNPWVLPAVAFVSGFGARLLVDNSTVKDIASGVMLAGGADAAKKGLDLLGTKVPALAQITGPVGGSIPALSGPDMAPPMLRPSSLRGTDMASPAMLRG
ncbi:hypothetical protein WSM22_03010 [Cytophagales bacterium WSM2-2]|nr:hypothetical protein WSM22_03010 [Cytophagales bacterium WSM2-2]